MQIAKVMELRRNWEAKGNPPCSHSSLDKEYYLGAATGDYACTACGMSNAGRDWPERQRGTQSN